MTMDAHDTLRSPDQEGAAGPGLSVEVERVHKIFETTAGEEVHAIADFSLRVRPGEFVAVLGPSGCGKSTLLSMLAGLDRPTSGHIRIGGAPLQGPHAGSSVVFQSDFLLPWRTVMDNVLLPIEIKKRDRAAHRGRAERLLAQVGLAGSESKMPHELSGGMRQRVAICRAIIQEPGLLLMDEPFGALDALTRDQMIVDLQALWLRLGNTVVFITHGIGEAILLADRVIVMSPRPGRIDLELKIDLPRPRDHTSTPLHPGFIRSELDIRRCFERRGVLKRSGSGAAPP